jgi:nucleoside-diphosphate-sugar epimerase
MTDAPKPILVTGATGFVGRALVDRFVSENRPVRAAVRGTMNGIASAVELVRLGDIGANTDWQAAVVGADAVVHLAARVHVTGEDARAGEDIFRTVNVEGSSSLARAVREAGVRRMILVSSATVYGDRSPGAGFAESDPPAPTTPYARSKLEGERAVAELLAGSRTGLVVLRPPLVYGPGAKGNFARLVRLVERGVPLPLASVRNRRSVLFVGNLVDAIVRALDHPAATGRTFNVADVPDVSTPGLITAIATALHRRPRLLPCPVPILRAAAAVVGRSDELSRLVDDMAVDTSRIRDELRWRPSVALNDALARSLPVAQGGRERSG